MLYLINCDDKAAHVLISSQVWNIYILISPKYYEVLK